MKYFCVALISLAFAGCSKSTSTAPAVQETKPQTDAIAAPPKADPKTGAASDSLGTQFRRLVSEFNKQRNAFEEQFNAASEETRKALAANAPTERKLAKEAIQLFHQKESDPSFIDVATWAFQYGDDECVAEVIDKLKAHHSESPMLPETLVSLIESSTPSSLSFLNSLSNDASNERLKFFARFVLAKRLSEQQDHEKIVALLKSVIDYPGDLEIPSRNLNLKVDADDFMFDITTLAIGQIAPKIEGHDEQGEAFKLSDYRGKVVMLDFWGDW